MDHQVGKEQHEKGQRDADAHCDQRFVLLRQRDVRQFDVRQSGAGKGAGLLFGFMLTRVTEIQSYETRSIVYGGSVLAFGGLGLIVSFIAERILSRRK